MPIVLTKILLSLLWAGVGVLAAWLSFLSLRKQAEALQPDPEQSLRQLPKMMAGRTLRLILVGVLIYLALRMDALYALVFVLALTIATWIMAVVLNKKANKPTADINLEQKG